MVQWRISSRHISEIETRTYLQLLRLLIGEPCPTLQLVNLRLQSGPCLAILRTPALDRLLLIFRLVPLEQSLNRRTVDIHGVLIQRDLIPGAVVRQIDRVPLGFNDSDQAGCLCNVLRMREGFEVVVSHCLRNGGEWY